MQCGRILPLRVGGRVLELGSGVTGVVGISATLLGAHVTLTVKSRQTHAV